MLLVGLIIGTVLLFISAVLLFLNEAFPSTADAVKAAKELTPFNASERNRDAVWIKGALHSENRASDTAYILVSNCIVLKRHVSVYTLHETGHDSDGDGSDDWYSEDYTWDADSVTTIVANDLKIEDYEFRNTVNLDFDKLPTLNLSGYVLPHHSLSFNYIYPDSNRGTPANPYKGDIRISYQFLTNGAEGIAVARLNGNFLEPYRYGSPPFATTVYHFFHEGSFEAVLKNLSINGLVRLWVLRAVGFLLMSGAALLIMLNFFPYAGLNRRFTEAAGWLRVLTCLAAAGLFTVIVVMFADLLTSLWTLIGILSFCAATVTAMFIVTHKQTVRLNANKPAQTE